ncbi:peptidylprolyl isomerase [Myroides sp. LJL119]
MKKTILFLATFLCISGALAQSHKLLFKTNYGDFKVVLYDFTPKHQALILQAIEQGEYNDALFNRVVENFVVQGGEHDIDIAQREKDLPLKKKKRLAPEFNSQAYHKVGALGAGRDDNPEKGSFLNQIYFVVGDKVTQEDLAALNAKSDRNWSYNDEQTMDYLHKGGAPRLDGDYTVFGEVYEGLDVLQKISKVKTDSKDYPIEKVTFEIQEII